MFIAAYGVVQRLILIGCYVSMGFMQGYQPVASYALGARNTERLRQSAHFALHSSLMRTVAVAAMYIALAKPPSLPERSVVILNESDRVIKKALNHNKLFLLPLRLRQNRSFSESRSLEIKPRSDQSIALPPQKTPHISAGC